MLKKFAKLRLWQKVVFLYKKTCKRDQVENYLWLLMNLPPSIGWDGRENSIVSKYINQSRFERYADPVENDLCFWPAEWIDQFPVTWWSLRFCALKYILFFLLLFQMWPRAFSPLVFTCPHIRQMEEFMEALSNCRAPIKRRGLQWSHICMRSV